MEYLFNVNKYYLKYFLDKFKNTIKNFKLERFENNFVSKLICHKITMSLDERS